MRDAVRCSWQDWENPRSLPNRTSAEADHVDETAQCQELRRRRSKADGMDTVPIFTILARLLWGSESKAAPIPLKRLKAVFAPPKFLL